MKDRERGHRIGVDRYLAKPLNMGRLQGDVVSLLAAGPFSRRLTVAGENSRAPYTAVAAGPGKPVMPAARSIGGRSLRA